MRYAQNAGCALARHILNLISDVFGYAVKMGVVSDNPCSKVSLPKMEHKEKQIYTPEQAARFLELLNDEHIKYRGFGSLQFTVKSVQ